MGKLECDFLISFTGSSLQTSIDTAACLLYKNKLPSVVSHTDRSFGGQIDENLND